MFNLTSGFLTQRDAWAGTFEGVVSELTSPRTDCPLVLPNVPSLRNTDADENRYVSNFQSEVVELASILSGDHLWSTSSLEIGNKMTVKDADKYVDRAISKFFRASKEAMRMGMDESAIVNLQSPRSSGNRVP